MEDLENVIYKLVSSNATPGVNYAVLKDQEIYTGSLGLKAKYKLNNDKLEECLEKNDIDTLYDIASLTKVVCTLPIIFRLKEKGKINLEDSVKKYLPEFKYDKITIFDLLTHRSGLPADLNSKDIISKNEIIEKLYSLKPENEIGTFKYSDIGYMLLGLVIEKVCNMPLDKVFNEEVAIPLEMTNTVFNPTDTKLCAPTEITIERGVVRGIVHDEKACSMEGIAGHAGLFSNIHDLTNFSNMILNMGTFNGKQYLEKESVESWFNVNATSISQSGNFDRSFSWFVGNNPNVIMGLDEHNKDVISFTGFTGPSISIDLKNNLIIIMLTNRVHPTRNNPLNTNMRSDVTDSIYKTINKNYKFLFR